MIIIDANLFIACPKNSEYCLVLHGTHTHMRTSPSIWRQLSQMPSLHHIRINSESSQLPTKLGTPALIIVLFFKERLVHVYKV